jgi:hypothetical protein
MQFESIREKIMPCKFFSKAIQLIIPTHLVNALFFIFAMLNCGIFIQMYNSLITSQTVRKGSRLPFKPNEVLQVLKERKYSLLFQKKTDVYNQVSKFDSYVFYSCFQDIQWSEDFSFFEVRNALKKYNNPVRFVEDLYGEDANMSVTKLLAKDRWITVANIENILYLRRYGICNHLYYPVSF